MTFCLPQKNSGMTLVEMVVVIGIYTILLLVITNSIFSIYQYNAYAIEQAGEIDNARRGMTQWNRDAKEMNVAEDGTFPVRVIQPHRFGYFSDTDADSTVEYVEYVLASTTVTKYTYNATGTPLTYNFSTPDSSEVLSRFVQNILQGTSTFFYYDDSGNQLGTSSPLLDVRYIQAQIIVNIDPERSPGEFMLRSSIAPRNLKDNL